MGDSSCLIRSFSGPSECSGEPKEGNLLRCLGESVSFGRYATEPLDWVKWSVFSHNRYLEEVQKFSKPGSVAEKKAYFEAQYKRKAAEKAAALAEVANMCGSNVSESVSMRESCQRSGSNVELENEENQMVGEVIVPITVVNDNDTDVEGTQLELLKVDGDGAEKVIQESANVSSVQDELETSIQVEMESSTRDEVPKQLERDEKVIFNGATQEEKVPTKEAPSEKSVTSPSKKRLLRASTSQLFTQPRPSKIPSFPAKQMAGVPTGKKANVIPKIRNSEADLVDKRKPATKSLHMSINFTSHANETSKRSSSVLEKIKNLRVQKTAVNVPVRNSSSLPTATRASVNGILTETSANPCSKDIRAKIPLSKSVTGRVAADGICKSVKSPLKDHPPTANGRKPRGPVKSCPFSLKSDERAAKRKEFFQRLKEKKSVEAEIKQPQMKYNKIKAVHDVKNLCPSTGSKAKDPSSGSQLLSTNLKKICTHTPVPLIRSQSQKLERQSTNGKVLNPNTRSSVYPHNIKHVTQSNNPRTSRSVTSLPKKNAHENSSPNIQIEEI